MAEALSHIPTRLRCEDALKVSYAATYAVSGLAGAVLKKTIQAFGHEHWSNNAKMACWRQKKRKKISAGRTRRGAARDLKTDYSKLCSAPSIGQ